MANLVAFALTTVPATASANQLPPPPNHHPREMGAKGLLPCVYSVCRALVLCLINCYCYYLFVYVRRLFLCPRHDRVKGCFIHQDSVTVEEKSHI